MLDSFKEMDLFLYLQFRDSLLSNGAAFLPSRFLQPGWKTGKEYHETLWNRELKPWLLFDLGMQEHGAE
jgi:hypothetical protein